VKSEYKKRLQIQNKQELKEDIKTFFWITLIAILLGYVLYDIHGNIMRGLEVISR
jgi:hypothetical protein